MYKNQLPAFCHSPLGGIPQGFWAECACFHQKSIFVVLVRAAKQQKKGACNTEFVLRAKLILLFASKRKEKKA